MRKLLRYGDWWLVVESVRHHPAVVPCFACDPDLLLAAEHRLSLLMLLVILFTCAPRQSLPGFQRCCCSSRFSGSR